MSMMVNPHRFAAAGGDPSFASVAFLSGFNGADGSTSFTDESSYARTVTTAGNAQVDTAQSKFGGSSLLLDGTGDYLTVPDADIFDLNGDPFTIEAWVRFTAVPSTLGICAKNLVSGTGGWGFYHASAALRFLGGRSGGDVGATAAWTPSTATWYHLCAERRSNGDVYLYRDGTAIGNSTGMAGRVIGANTASVKVGALELSGSIFGFNGHLDEVRITPGVARYNGNFTPPAAAFPRS
jgi:hypothetical protein